MFQRAISSNVHMLTDGRISQYYRMLLLSSYRVQCHLSEIICSRYTELSEATC